MTVETFASGVAAVNAGLNLTSALLLIAGFRYIRRKEIASHRKCMIGAVTASALFLVLYVIRFCLTGTHRFEGPEAARTVYLGILFSHMVLAVVILPMVIRLLYLARIESFGRHRRLARWTFPLWLYVSASGLAVYLLLYHVYPVAGTG